jgi:hypothetical protein
MYFNKHEQFLTTVKNYIEKHPDAAPFVTEYVAAGLEASRQTLLDRLCDMETALLVALSKRFKGADKLILSKIKPWVGKTSIPLEDTVKDLENAISLKDKKGKPNVGD